jgi:uncharacterized membrane protein SirB2
MFDIISKLAIQLNNFLTYEIDLKIIPPLTITELLSSGLLLVVLTAVFVKKVAPFL